MFVASVVAVIISGGAFTAIVVVDRDTGASPHLDGQSGGDPTGAATGPVGGLGDGPVTGAPGAVGDEAECLVGSWRAVSVTQGAAGGIASLLDGQMVLVSEGPVFDFHADGTGRADYGDATIFEAQTLGDTVEMAVQGQIEFGFQAADGQFRLVDPSSNATATMPLVGSFPYQLDTDPVSFTCDGQVAEFSDEDRQYTARYERLN